MASATSYNLSASLMKQYWHNYFLDSLRSNLVFHDLGQVGTVPGGSGITVHWLSMADLSVNTTAADETGDPTDYQITGSDQTATLTAYNNAVRFSRAAAKVWIDGSMEGVMDKIARLAKHQVDRKIRDSIMTAGGLVQYAGSVAVARTGLCNGVSDDYADMAEFRQAKATLQGVDVAPHSNGFYVAVVHPDAAYDLQSDTTWTDVAKYGESSRLLNGEIGNCYGIKFVQTTECLKMTNSGSIAGAVSSDVYQSYVMGNQYFGVSELENVDIVVKDPAPASSVNGYSTIGYYMMFTQKQLQASAMIRLESAGTFGA